MFICLYCAIDPSSDSAWQLLERGEEETRAPSSPHLQRKGDKGARGVPLLRVVLAVVPLTPPILLFPLLLPRPYPDPSLCISQRRGGGQGSFESSSSSSSKGEKTKDCAAFLSSALSSPRFPSSPLFSPFLSYSPCYPAHPLRPEECIVESSSTGWLLYCCVPRPPAFFCVSSAVPLHSFWLQPENKQ